MLRLLAGAMLIIVALTTAVGGFLMLTGVLANGGYGTPPMVHALVVLGASGALLAGGVATLIWDISKRYENP